MKGPRSIFALLLHHSDSSRLLLRCGRLCFSSLLPVTPNHDHAQEGANNGRAQKDENNGDSDGPNARREEVMKRVSGVDKGLNIKSD